MVHLAAGSEGVSTVVGTGWHRLGGGEEKGGRGSNGFGFGLVSDLGGEESSGAEWSGVERKSKYP